MAISPALRALDIDLPACPQNLVELSLLMNDEAANMQAISTLIESDMALASAVVRTVNSALFGLLRRVGSVSEAVRYLGTREVAGITYEIALRGAFRPSPRLTALWARAARRGLVMGRSAVALDIDPWLAHTAGLFAESGEAALVAHDASGYEALAAREPASLPRLELEIASYGVSQAALGGALCHAWRLAGDVAESVRTRPLGLIAVGRPSAHEAVKLAHDWSQEPEVVRRLLALGTATDLALAGADATAQAEACDALGRLGGIDAALLQATVQLKLSSTGE